MEKNKNRKKKKYIFYILHTLCRLNVDIESNIQVLPVATHLPLGYLSIQPLGLGKGVRVRSIIGTTN